MGVNLSKIVISENSSLSGYKGKKIAIDAPNTLYQFLSIIRQRDGTPLKDSQGRVTSHLSGLLYRTANLVEHRIKPVYVFDGQPHYLKTKTLKKRRDIKERAMVEWLEALETGDLEEARKKAQQTSRLSSEYIQEAKELLTALGIPYIESKGEGEAQASQMTAQGLVDLTSSQDFDCLLFGSPFLLRNLTLTGRRKVPGKKKWIDIQPEKIVLANVLKTHNITQEQLVEIAILVGTDFNEGIKGIGPINGLKLIRDHGSLEGLLDSDTISIEGIESYKEIKNIFLNPEITIDVSLRWKPLDKDLAIDFLCDKHQFSRLRVDSALKKFEDFSESLGQKKLFDF